MASENYTYRFINDSSLTAEQFAQIVQIEQNCGLEPYTPQMLMTCIADMDTVACFDGERVVGFLTAHPNRGYDSCSVYIVNLNVEQTYRGQGIAKRLLYVLCTRYRSSMPWLGSITLDVMKTNRAMELYRQLGFRMANVPSRNGDTDVVMVTAIADLLKRIRELLDPIEV